MIGFLVQGRVRIKIKIGIRVRVRVRVRVGVTFNVRVYHWSNCHSHRSKCCTFQHSSIHNMMVNKHGY